MADPDESPDESPDDSSLRRAADEWRAAVARVDALVTEALCEDAAALDVVVPACPDWTARNLLAHVVGLDADVLAGQEADDHNPEWTQAQVDRRRDDDGQTLLDEWRALADDLVAHMLDGDPRPLGDVVIHEQDLRGALGRPGARDTAGLAQVRATIADRVGAAVREQDVPPLRLETTDEPAWAWQSHDGEPGAVVHASGFDLFRAVTSRRSADQLRAWTTSGDVDPYLPTLAALGPLPQEDPPL